MTDKNNSICGSISGLHSGSILVYYVAKFWKCAPNLPTPYASSQIIYKFLWAGGETPTNFENNSQILPFDLKAFLSICDYIMPWKKTRF